MLLSIRKIFKIPFFLVKYLPSIQGKYLKLTCKNKILKFQEHVQNVPHHKNYIFRFAKLTIECVRDITLKEAFRGMIRKEDIREYEKDKIEIYKSFRPGDIILAKVISLGEASSGFLLSTAEDDLGVAIAKSESSGMKMIPISWQEMQCPKTYNKEFRKVAQIIPDESARPMDSTSVNAE